jgi:hypothetical protein
MAFAICVPVNYSWPLSGRPTAYTFADHALVLRFEIRDRIIERLWDANVAGRFTD